jgi:hypothetical protein
VSCENGCCGVPCVCGEGWAGWDEEVRSTDLEVLTASVGCGVWVRFEAWVVAAVGLCVC